MLTRIFKGAAVSLLALALMPAASVYATAGTGAASLSLSPASGQKIAGTSFSVTVSETSSEPVVAVEADFTYDASKLRCDNVDVAGSAFSTTYQNSCAGGSVTIARGTQGTTVSGKQKVATIHFTVLGNTGTASIVAAGSSEIDNTSVANVCNNTCATGTVLASYTLAAPVTSTTTPSTPTPGTAPHTTTTPKTTTTKNNTNAVAGQNTAQTPATPTSTPATAEQPKAEDAKPAAKATNQGNNAAWILGGILLAALLGAGLYYLNNRAAQAKAAEAAAAAAAAKKAKAAKKTPAKKAPAKKPAAKRATKKA